MGEAELYEHFCGGYRCDQPGVIEIKEPSGGFFGWLCEDHADDLERDLFTHADLNRQRLLARGADE